LKAQKQMKTAKKLPAEWEKQSFLQLTFPHQESDWAYLMDEVTVCFVEIIETTARFQDVLVVCDNVERVKSFFKSTQNIYFIQIESNDTWARDHGGITVIENGNAVIHDYIFNGWGNKFDAGLDNQITQKLFNNDVFENCNIKTSDLVLEGGSLESDGKGTILTTSECLLSKNRNEHLSKVEIEQFLKENFGAESVLWLNHGYLAGDDTDSHIDTLARFCDEKTIAYVGCENQEDEHFEALQQMKKELQQFIDFQGKPYKLVEIPLPDACFDSDGNRLPATYVNFTIINGAVLVPVYGVAQDEKALEILQGCFPDRKVIGINCRVLIEQHGSLHCVTMQYPVHVKLNTKILS
jgi:agmatine/peptidylarginine deiminase